MTRSTIVSRNGLMKTWTIIRFFYEIEANTDV